MDSKSPEKPEEFFLCENLENILFDHSDENGIDFESITAIQTYKDECYLYIPSKGKALIHREINSNKHETKDIKLVKTFLNKKRL